MLRIAFTVFMILHGALHLIGFAKEWNITSYQLSRRLLVLTGHPSRLAGTLWLLACILFVTASLVYLLRKDWYWIPAAAGLVISQTLIVGYWDDAKYGTVINLVLLVVVILSAAAMQFNRATKSEVEMLMKRSTGIERIVTEEMIARLPEVVQRWVRQSGIIGKPVSNTFRIAQAGTLRTTPYGRWMPFRATQHVSIDPPGFVWAATIQAAPMITIGGRDEFQDGHGQMIIKPLYLFNAANSSGPEIDQGSLLRYLGEMVWFPQAAVSDYLDWEQIDNSRARVTMTFAGTSVSGMYYFDEAGQVTRFEAIRFGDFKGAFKQELWSVTATGYRSFNGTRIASNNEVTWKLKEGDFTWLKLEITDIRPVR